MYTAVTNDVAMCSSLSMIICDFTMNKKRHKKICKKDDEGEKQQLNN